MKVKTGFRRNDAVTYSTGKEKVPAIIIRIIPNGTEDCEYEIRVTKTGRTYKRHDVFTTTGNWLSLRPTSKRASQATEKRREEKKQMEALKALAGNK